MIEARNQGPGTTRHRQATAPVPAPALAVDAFFRRHAPALAAAPGVVAFSGGADSCALLLAFTRRHRAGGAPVIAVHLDHGADPDSRRRARRAAALARHLGVPFVEHRRPVPAERREGESPEAAARRVRYAFLARVARDAGAAWVATAHHADDQAETVLLRLAFGSGLRGLGGVRPVRPSHAGGPPLLRPLLALRRHELERAVAAAGLEPVDDPTNLDPAVPRNRVRHHLLPALGRGAAGGEDPVPRLARLAARARGATQTLDRRLEERLAPRRRGDGADLDLAAFTALPAPLRSHALALLHAWAGVPYPAGQEARRELERQLSAAAGELSRVGVDCGDGWRWEERDGRLALLPATAGSPPREFSYILGVPGEVAIPELGRVLRLYRAPVAGWMFRGARHRAGLALPLATGDTVTVRNRRPGDRLQPLGAGGTRRLKEVLIDRRVPRQRRDRLPLLCLGATGDDIVWVPGVTVEHRHRLPDPPPIGATVWVAEVTEPCPNP